MTCILQSNNHPEIRTEFKEPPPNILVRVERPFPTSWDFEGLFAEGMKTRAYTREFICNEGAGPALYWSNE